MHLFHVGRPLRVEFGRLDAGRLEFGARFGRIRQPQPDRHLEVGDGVVAVALHAVGEAARVIGLRVVATEGDRRGVVVDGAPEIALGPISIGAHRQSVAVARLESHGLAGVGDRAVGVAEREDRRAVNIGGHRLWVAIEIFVVVGERRLEVADDFIGPPAQPVDLFILGIELLRRGEIGERALRSDA